MKLEIKYRALYKLNYILSPRKFISNVCEGTSWIIDAGQRTACIKTRHVSIMNHYMTQLYFPSLGRERAQALHWLQSRSHAMVWFVCSVLSLAALHLAFSWKTTKGMGVALRIIPHGGLSLKELPWQPAHSRGLQVAHSSPKKQTAVPLNAPGLSDWAMIGENSQGSSFPWRSEMWV